MLGSKIGDIIAAAISGAVTFGVSYYTSRSMRKDIAEICVQELAAKEPNVEIFEDDESEEA